MSGPDRRRRPHLAFIDTEGDLKPRIEQLLDGTGVSRADFLRQTVADRVDEMEQAESKIASERAARVVISGVPDDIRGR